MRIFTKKYWNEEKAVLPFLGRRLRGFTLENAFAGACVVSCCAVAPYTPLADYSPLTTQQEIGQVISFEETGSHNIPTFVVDNGTDTEVVYKNLDGEWSQIVETEVGVTVQPAPNVQTSLQSIVKNHNAEIAPAEGSIVQSSTFFPTFR